MPVAASVRFATVVQVLAAETRRQGLVMPGFRSPPAAPGLLRAIGRRPDGQAVVAVRLRGRPFADVVADMVEGVVVANRLVDSRATLVRTALLAAVLDGHQIRGRVSDIHARPPVAVQIRQADPGQFEELGRLTVDAYAGLVGFEPGDSYLAELGDVARRAALAVVLVAVDDDQRVLGGVTYVPGPGPYYEWEGHDGAGPPAPDSAGIRMLAVALEARGAGVGTALVRACLDRARAEGRARVWLHTTPEMTQAHRIYEREGFVRAPDADWKGEVRLWAYVLELEGQVRR